MAVPTYLAASFSYLETALITDVADLITAIADELVNQNDPAWTDMGGGVYKSPVDGSGRWIDITLTRIAASNLNMKARDSGGNTICEGRMQIGSGKVCRIFSGQFHFHVETVVPGASAEYIRAGILDLSPESQTAHTQWCYAHTYRTTADAIRGNVHHGQTFMWDNAAYTEANRATGIMILSGQATYLSPSGGYMFFALCVLAKAPGDATNYWYAGRPYNYLIGDPSRLTPGAEFTIPIDVGTFGTFKVSGLASSTYSQALFRVA